MTEMVCGTVPRGDGDPALPRWRRTAIRNSTGSTTGCICDPQIVTPGILRYVSSLLN